MFAHLSNIYFEHIFFVENPVYLRCVDLIYFNIVVISLSS